MVNPFFVLVPLYIYPLNNAWVPLMNSIAANPSINFKIVINPSNGPGGNIPDSNYMNGIAMLNNYTNVNMYGYVYSAYGLRWANNVEQDIQMYSSWASTNASIAMDGIFLDQAPETDVFYNYVSQISQYTQSLFGSGTSTGLFMNPGSTVASDLYNLVDYVNTFESTQAVWDMYEGFDVSYIPCAVRSQSSVIIYDYLAPNSMLASDAQALVDSGAAGAFLTSEIGLFGSWPVNWWQFVNAIGAAINATNTAARASPCVALPSSSSSSSSAAPASSTAASTSNSAAAPTSVVVVAASSAAASASSTALRTSTSSAAISSSTSSSSSSIKTSSSSTLSATTLSTLTSAASSVKASSTSTAKATTSACYVLGLQVPCL